MLVKVSASGDHLEVLRWAATEAVRRGHPLRLVHVTRRRGSEGPLVAARLWLRRWFPALRVSSESRSGDVAEELAEAATTAGLLVLGHHEPSAIAVLSLATCPAVAVPPARLWPATRVVVGVDGSERSAATLGFAFGQARHTGHRLEVVHCWPDPAAELTSHGERWLTLATLMSEHAGAHPDVASNLLLRDGDPVDALLRRAHRAALLVLGAGHHTAPALLGRVTRALLRQARCPVAVVRPAEVLAGGAR